MDYLAFVPSSHKIPAVHPPVVAHLLKMLTDKALTWLGVVRRRRSNLKALNIKPFSVVKPGTFIQEIIYEVRKYSMQ